MVSLNLRFLRNFTDKSLSWVMTVMGIPIVEAFGAHELA